MSGYEWHHDLVQRHFVDPVLGMCEYRVDAVLDNAATMEVLTWLAKELDNTALQGLRFYWLSAVARKFSGLREATAWWSPRNYVSVEKWNLGPSLVADLRRFLTWIAENTERKGERFHIFVALMLDDQPSIA